MKEYNIIGTFKYNKSNYELLLDNNNKYFFLKINNNYEYEYITLKELIELSNIFKNKEDIMLFSLGKKEKNKKKIKIIPKILIGTIAITISLSLLNILDHKSTDTNNIKYSSSITYVENENIEKDKTQETIDKVLAEIEEEKENFEVETIREGVNLKIIFDNSELDDALGYNKESITYDTLRETIKNNSNISDKFKTMYLNLISNLESQYPTMDLRIWYENLKTLKIVECDEMEMKLKAVSATAYACYRKDENTIYTVKDYNYEPGTWEYQVIIHEMCHPIRSTDFEKDNTEITTKFQNKSGNGTIIDEAMNSLLSLRSYDANEKDIAYQLQSNMIEIMVDSMDNYTYQDYVEHNITYFENELNKQNNNDNAVNVLSLIELQYKDYHDDTISVDQEQFYEIYDYIAKMYYEKHITKETTYEEANQIKEELVEKITYDVPEEYNIDTNHFSEYLKTYCEEEGISIEKTR
jgi:hypothetical protein